MFNPEKYSTNKHKDFEKIILKTKIFQLHDASKSRLENEDENDPL